MAKRYERSEVIARLRAQTDARRPIVIVGAGTGISAKFAERGGADLVGVYNSGKFRMDGHGSLAGLMPYGDANGIVLDLGARTVLPVLEEAPAIAGICGSDPTRDTDVFLRQLIALNFSGVMNFPTVGLIDGRFRQELEDTGMGYGVEIAALELARELGLFTLGYAFSPEEGAAVGAAGLDVVIAHMGLTRGGSIGSKVSAERALEEAAELVTAIGDAARAQNPEIMLLAHGGPIAFPDDTELIYERTEAVGFLGASSVERIPVEGPLREATASFKEKRLPERSPTRGPTSATCSPSCCFATGWASSSASRVGRRRHSTTGSTAAPLASATCSSGTREAPPTRPMRTRASRADQASATSPSARGRRS